MYLVSLSSIRNRKNFSLQISKAIPFSALRRGLLTCHVIVSELGVLDVVGGGSGKGGGVRGKGGGGGGS